MYYEKGMENGEEGQRIGHVLGPDGTSPAMIDILVPVILTHRKLSASSASDRKNMMTFEQFISGEYEQNFLRPEKCLFWDKEKALCWSQGFSLLNIK